jgi:hypothetical protein
MQAVVADGVLISNSTITWLDTAMLVQPVSSRRIAYLHIDGAWLELTDDGGALYVGYSELTAHVEKTCNKAKTR